MRDELTFLGHRVSKDGIRCEVDKLAAIKDYPAPRNLAELRTWLGLCGFYAKFVPRFTDIAAPLTALQREDVPYVWGPEQEAAFEHLKQAFTNPPCLHVADPCRPFIVHVDASGFALGAALMQDFGRGLQPVAYCSRKLKDAETRYAPHDREMLAVVSALEHWQHYLRGAAKVTVCSDHFSLQHFFSQPSLNQRQLRWKDFLDSLNLEINYIQGSANVVADCLSRNPLYLNTVCVAPVATVIAVSGDIASAFAQAYAADPVCQRIAQKLQNVLPFPAASSGMGRETPAGYSTGH